MEAGVATALIGIFTAVCTPVFLYFQAQLKELKADRDKDRAMIVALQHEVAACHEERMNDRIWRAKWESTIEAIAGAVGSGDPRDLIGRIRDRVKADRAVRKAHEREGTEGNEGDTDA